MANLFRSLRGAQISKFTVLTVVDVVSAQNVIILATNLGLR